MRRTTVRRGLHELAAAVVLLTVGTFYHHAVAAAFHFRGAGEATVVAACFGMGGLVAGIGALTAAAGLSLRENSPDGISLRRSLLVLLVLVAIFFSLFRARLHEPERQLQPGETITI